MRVFYHLVVKLLTKWNPGRAKEWRHAELYGMSEKFFIKSILADKLKRWF